MVLGVRSSVFASTYSHDTVESKAGIVEIADCDSEIFDNFLMFLYSGKLELLSSGNIAGLYTVADKYKVEDLKQVCLNFMMSNLSVENFYEVVVLALKYNELDLLNSSTVFFVKNAIKICKTPDWLCFLKDYPIESNKLYVKALEYHVPQ